MTSKAADFKSLTLDEQIDARRSEIRADKLDMTYGEFANMYEDKELVVAPAYQRLFRWKERQKTRFIESILLGIPTPAIFVAETEDGVWELIDGLQRLSTVLEFFGVLKDADGEPVSPSQLVADEGAELPTLDGLTFDELSLRSRLSIRRAGCRVEVVKVGSGRRMKYDLFERLNTGGAQLTEQEIRNCIFRAEAPDLMEYFDGLAQFEPFRACLGLSEREHEKKLNVLVDRRNNIAHGGRGQRIDLSTVAEYHALVLDLMAGLEEALDEAVDARRYRRGVPGQPAPMMEGRRP